MSRNNVDQLLFEMAKAGEIERTVRGATSILIVQTVTGRPETR